MYLTYVLSPRTRGAITSSMYAAIFSFGQLQAGIVVPCNHPSCRTCQRVSSSLTVNGPNCSINIKEHFSCHSSNLIYCVSCRRCPALFIGETSRALQERFGEHLKISRFPRSWDPFLETPDNLSCPVSIFSSSFTCQLMVIIGANLAICFTKF